MTPPSLIVMTTSWRTHSCVRGALWAQDSLENHPPNVQFRPWRSHSWLRRPDSSGRLFFILRCAQGRMSTRLDAPLDARLSPTWRRPNDR